MAHATDIFDMMFGGGRRGGEGGGRRRGDDVQHILEVSLKELYTGATRKLMINRVVVDKDVPITTCNACDGQGATVKVIRMGPMIQQVRIEGSGRAVLRESRRVRKCLVVFFLMETPPGLS